MKGVHKLGAFPHASHLRTQADPRRYASIVPYTMDEVQNISDS